MFLFTYVCACMETDKYYKKNKGKEKKKCMFKIAHVGRSQQKPIDKI